MLCSSEKDKGKAVESIFHLYFGKTYLIKALWQYLDFEANYLDLLENMKNEKK